jgi:hypothetical protein
MQPDSPRRLGWLDGPDALARIRLAEQSGQIDSYRALACRFFHQNGYWIAPQIVPEAMTEPAAKVPYTALEGRMSRPRAELIAALQDCFVQHGCLRDIMVHAPMLDWCDLFLGARALPYQTLSLPESSQQGAHSDEILMSSEPRGGMIAAWVALEDVHTDAGPLQVWPASHLWDYVGAKDLSIPATASEGERSAIFDASYYGVMQQQIERRRAEAETMILRRGDVLFWHQALVHGALPIDRVGATRNSLIIHYFADGARWFSDLWARGCTLPGLR